MLKKKTLVVFGMMFSFIGGLTLAGCGETVKTPIEQGSQNGSQSGNQQGNQQGTQGNQNQQGNQGTQNQQGSQNQQGQQGNQGLNPGGNQQGNQQGNQGNQGGQGDLGDNGGTQNPPKPSDDFSEANAFLTKLDNNNFSYNSGSVQVQRQGDLISYAEPSYVDYYQRSNGQTYTYIFQSSDQKWHKKELDGQDVFAIVDDMIASFQSVQWSAQSGNTYTGSSTLGQLKLTLKDEFSGIFNALGQDVEVFDVGRTVVSLPAVEQVVDESKTQPENPPRPETNKLFEVVNGQKQWNFPLLKETLQTWMIENGYLTKLSLGIQCDLQDIVYLNVDKNNKIEFLALMNSENKNLFQNFNINDNLTMLITNAKITTPQEFKSSLSNEMQQSFGIGKGPIETIGMAQYFEYSTLDEDYGTHQAEFEKMTQNIFNRLETIGYQSGSINNPGTIVTDYKDAKVLFGIMGQRGRATPGADMGYIQVWKNYYLVENHGKVSFLEVGLNADANTSKDPLQFILDNTNQKKWKVSSIKETLLQGENLDLYVNSIQNKSKE